MLDSSRDNCDTLALSRTLVKNVVFALLYLNPGNTLFLSWLKTLLLILASTVKNGKNRLRKENRQRWTEQEAIDS